MSIRLKYLSTLKKITGVILGHYGKYCIMAAVVSKVVFGLLALGTPVSIAMDTQFVKVFTNYPL